MSVRKDPRSQYYTYQFQIEGHRFFGSTKKRSKREALAVEVAERENAKKIVAAAQRTKSGPLTLDFACGKYWQEVGQHHAGADTTWVNLQRLIEFFGKDTLLSDITDEKVARLIAWRRGQQVISRRKKPKKNPAPVKLVSNATVNRSTLEPLKKIFNRAQNIWKIKFENAQGESTVPKWSQFRLKERDERVREMSQGELAKHLADLRADYAPFFAFAREVAPRMRECLIRKSQVDWDAGIIYAIGKGGKQIRIVITARIRAILQAVWDHHAEWVFTYVAQRSRPRMGIAKGARYPITYQGLKSYWRRHQRRTGLRGEGIDSFRFHDFRHDLGTKLLRKTGNLKMVQKALNHSSVKTTVKYAHVLDEDLRHGLEQVSDSRGDRLRDASATKKPGENTP